MEPAVLYAWILIGVGVAIWWAAQQMPVPLNVGGKSSGGSSRVISVIGLGLLGVGLYAGFRGPVTVGSVTLGPFSFAHFIETSHAEADNYAKTQIQISSRPAPLWRGGSKIALECTVRNAGNKGLHSLLLRLDGTAGKSVDLKLIGPFPAGQTTAIILDIPADVKRIYFTPPGIQLGNIVGARF